MPRGQRPTPSPLRPLPPQSHIPQTMPIRLPQQSQHQGPSIVQSIKDGFGMGVGMSVARNIVDGIMKPATAATAAPAAATIPEPVPLKPKPVPYANMADFKKCMETMDYETCKTHLE